MDAARWKAEQTARIQADREADAAKMARLAPVTEAEMDAAAAEPREDPAIDPADAARWKAEQTARVQADREADAEKALLTPERAAYEADMAEIRAGTERVGELVDQMPDREAERRAELERELVNEPTAPQVEAEPSLEPSWEPGEVSGPAEVGAEVEVELEI